MEPNKPLPNALAQQIAALHETYKERLPARLEGLSVAWKSYRVDARRETLHKMLQILQELKAKGAGFVFKEISSLAAELETILEELFENHGLTAQQRTAVSWYLEQLHDASEPTQSTAFHSWDTGEYVQPTPHESSSFADDLPAITYWSSALLQAVGSGESSSELVKPNYGPYANVSIDDTISMNTSRRPLIMVLDDDFIFSQQLRSEFHLAGLASLIVNTGEGVQELARKRMPSAILIETEVAGISGFSLCKELRKEAALAETPIFFYSHGASEEDMVQALDDGADDYIDKTISVQVLIAKLKRTIARRAAEPQNRLVDLKEGSVFAGRYLLLELLGIGGGGQVYLTRHDAMELPLAIKFHQADTNHNTEMTERFRREIQVLGLLNHPNIVRLYDAGTSGDIFYYTMDYLADGSLANFLAERGALSLIEALDYIIPIAAGLQSAHDNHILHRDLKPENILLRGGSPVISDFGVLLHTRSEASRRLTQVGQIIGTAHYMAPEQVLTPQNIGPPSDVYALGVLLYKMLTGAEPFFGAAPQAAPLLCISGQIPPLQDRVPTLPDEAAALCMAALSTNPRERIQTASELEHRARELRELFSGENNELKDTLQ